MVATFTGTGEVSVPATSATLSFSLAANNTSVQGAIGAVKTGAVSVRQTLKSSGIAEEDITESQVTAVPANLVTAGATGFQATIVMSAKTVHVTNVADLISNLYSSGVYLVSQPTLAVEKQEELEAKALDAAMTDAKSQASKFALKNWKFIKKIIAVSQQSSGTTSTSTSKADTLTEAASTQAAQNGVFKIVKAASVTYKMW